MFFIFFSCSNNSIDTNKEKNKENCNYLYSKFVRIEDKVAKPFGKDTLYELLFYLETDYTNKCYKILTKNKFLYEEVKVCDEMLVTIEE